MGMLMRAGAVLGLVLSSAVAVVLTATPALAAPVPCTQEFPMHSSDPTAGPGQTAQVGTWVDRNAWIRRWPMVDEVRVTDVDVRFGLDLQYGDGTQLAVRLLHDGYGVFVKRQRPWRAGLYSFTFDSDAASWWIDDTVSQGTFRPDDSFDALTFQPVEGSWALEVRNAGGAFARITHATVVITTDVCDSDGDGVLETADNCPTVANADQTDWDADGRGNACDPSPGTDPNAPAPTQPPTTSPTSTPTPTTTPPTSLPGCVGGCTYDRSIALAYTRKKHRLSGTVGSVASGCRSGVEVTIWRKRGGNDQRLVVVTTRGSGAFRTKAPRRPGRYYASVGSASEPLCASVTSRAVRVRRR